METLHFISNFSHQMCYVIILYQKPNKSHENLAQFISQFTQKKKNVMTSPNLTLLGCADFLINYFILFYLYTITYVMRL